MRTRGDSRESAWKVIAGREINVRIRDKAYLGATAFLLVALIVGIVLSSVLGGRPESFRLGVVDDAGAHMAESAQEVLRSQSDTEDVVEAVDLDSVDDAEGAVTGESLDAALVPVQGGYELLGDRELDSSLSSAVATAVASTVPAAHAEGEGVDLASLSQGATVDERLLDEDAEDAGLKDAVAFGFAILFLFTALGFGMTIAQSVVQEKESRVVEILAAAVPVRQMLWGKIIGNTLLALIQIVLLVLVGAVGLAVTGRGDVLGGLGLAALWYVLLFVLGFLALASLWTVAGSLATSQEDLQSTTLPGQVLLFGPYFVAVFAGDSVQEVVSMLPIVSTMIMPGRIAQGEAPLWQIAVAVLATVIAALLLIRLGARLYERTLLQTSRRLTYREALRLPPE
ncbi:hypothetical protein BH24ACT12_BH24ACT12_10480 [soil metagenome]